MNPEQFLNSLVNYEKIPGYDYNLDEFRKFLTTFQTPHLRLNNVIHIAGTKGKGSTAEIISSVLQASGYRVGLFTSPHLGSINERIRINGQCISTRDMAYYTNRIRPHIKKRHRARTFFEVLTTIAFMHFVRAKTDVSILETGLGGRLDATNVTTPLVSVITRIGYDHMHLLGTTLSAIAREKCGIIKQGVPVVTIHQRPTVERIINTVARAHRSELFYAEDYHTVTTLQQSLCGSRLGIHGACCACEVFFSAPGRHQLENLLIALAVVYHLQGIGYTLPVRAIKKGIEDVHLRGRFEVISRKPLIVFDSAHNRDSFRALHNTLDDLRIRNFILIFGCSRDKDIRHCMTHIMPKAREILLVRTENPRAQDPTELYTETRKYNNHVTIAPSVKSALDYARRKKSATVVTGSFYLWQNEWTKHRVALHSLGRRRSRTHA